MLRTITTASGEIFDSTWDGVSTIDGILRIGIVNSDADRVHAIFSDKEQTAELTRTEDDIVSIYTGYTDYRGFQIDDNGEIMVCLAPQN